MDYNSIFSYLLDSSIHQSATALDPRIKLTFTDNTNPKFFVFSSTSVKQHINSLLPISELLPVTTVTAVANDLSANGAKRRRLLDFSTNFPSETSTSLYNEVKVNLNL